MSPVPFRVASEGGVDLVLAGRLLQEVGAESILQRRLPGRPALLKKAHAYNLAAKHGCWLLLCDLDRDPCAAGLVAAHLPTPSRFMCFRVAVREVEAWLLADRTGFSAFFGVSAAKIQPSVETILDPKRLMVQLAGQSSIRRIREGMTPERGSRATIGPLYTTLLQEFADGPWSPKRAVKEGNAESLRRAIAALEKLVQRFRRSTE